jgi:hypothetical protein
VAAKEYEKLSKGESHKPFNIILSPIEDCLPK